jgi:hypothetical protein
MKGYRTLALNVAAALGGTLMATDWGSLADPKTAGLIVTGLGLANTILRFFTSGPVGGGTSA